MQLLIKGGRVYDGEKILQADLLVTNGEVAAIGENLKAEEAEVFDAAGCLVAPGFCDLHVHLREPGFCEKETIATGTAAAAAGGFTTVCAMPNLDPVPDNLAALGLQMDAVAKTALVNVLPYAALTVNEMGDEPAEIEKLARFVAGFSDDGRGVQSDETMRACMRKVEKAGSMVAAHCEVEALLPPAGVGTCVQEGCRFAAEYGYVGHSNESESAEVERDIALAAETGCRLHICHTSAAESFAAVRAGKAKGVPVTCEVTPHNLLLSCDDITEDSGRFKMNPPFRSEADKAAALEALLDGTVDAIATDHAPHTAAEKEGTFAQSLNGVVGLETAFPSLYTGLVETGKVGLEKLVSLFTEGPARVLGRPAPKLKAGAPASLVVLDLESERVVDPKTFKTKGRATPFEGWTLKGWPVLTLFEGKEVFRRGN